MIVKVPLERTLSAVKIISPLVVLPVKVPESVPPPFNTKVIAYTTLALSIFTSELSQTSIVTVNTLRLLLGGVNVIFNF